MFFGNRTQLRIASWPVLILMLFYAVYFPHIDGAARAWANEPLPSVDSAPIEINWGAIPSQPGMLRPALLRKAAELENHPIRIYRFVRNQVEYQPYSGVRFGALGTLERMRGNDADQALLLIALLRAAWRNMGRPDPELSLASGSVRLTGEQALAVFGVQTRAAVAQYLGQAGVRHSIVGATTDGPFEVIVENHYWVRGDLEYGHLRGTRFAEGAQSAKVELDPSFVMLEETAEVPEPAQLTGVRAADFVQQVMAFVVRDAGAGSASKLPEGFFIAQADSAAAVFRRFLEQEQLTPEQALSRRRPTVERIDTLPEALVWTLENRPTAISATTTMMGGWTAFDAALEPLRHKVQVRVTTASSGAVLADATLATPKLYRRALTVDFSTADTLSSATLAAPQLDAAQLNALALNARVHLLENDPATGDVTVGSTPATTVAYGTPVRVQIALAGPGSLAPIDDAAATREVIDSRAGAMLAIAALPSLNAENALEYRTRYQLLSSAAAEATPRRAAGLPLDLAAQAILAQNENLMRLGALAGGHRTSTTSEWAIAGLEPVLAKDEAGADVYTAMRYIFAVREGAVPLGSALPSGDVRLADTASLQGVSQLMREALLAVMPALALGDAVAPATAGRLAREANAIDLPLYTIDSSNADALDEPADRIPANSGTLAANLQARADAGASLLLASSRVATADPGAGSLAGTGLWGYTQSDARGIRSSQVRLADGTLRRAFSDQQTGGIPSFLLGPAGLLGSAPETTPAFRRLADLSIAGVEAWDGAREATAQAWVAALHPLAQLLGDGEGLPADELAARTGATVVFLHALLDEFSRPEVLNIELEIEQGGVVRTVAPGEVFNPLLCSRVVARGQFNQTLETYRWVALDGPGVPRGRFPEIGQQPPVLDVRETTWILRNTVPSEEFPDVVDAFTWVPNHYENGDSYSGPLQLRLEGSLAGRTSRQKSTQFVIDTKAPTISIVGWAADRAHRGDLSVIGTADDLHFRDYSLEVAPQGSDAWELVQSGATAVSNGRLGLWAAGQLGRNGNFTFRLTASDVAGNVSAPVLSNVLVQNDITPPTIRIAKPLPTSPLTGTASLAVEASDSGSANSGLRSFKAWLEYERRNQQYQVQPATETLVDTRIDGSPVSALAFPASFLTNPAIAHTFDTRKYQARANSPLRLVVRAEDDFGLVTEQVRQWAVNNLLFNCFLTRGTINPASSINNTEVYIFQSLASPPDVRVKRNGTSGNGVLLERAAGPTTIDGAGTTFFSYRFNGATPVPGGVTQGAYTITVKQGAETQDLPVVVYTGSNPTGSLESPLATIYLKDVPMPDEVGTAQDPVLPGVIRIRGTVDCDALSLNNGLADTTPLEKLSPAPRPYWHLAYKPHEAEPLLEVARVESLAQISFNPSSLAHEENWIKIAHGYSETPPPVAGPDGTVDPTDFPILARWDVKSVPTGVYDLRLLVADGMLYYSKTVIPGITVTNSTILPGDDPDKRDPGALTLRQVDMSVRFEGFPVDIARSYSSWRGGIKGDFGFGWTLDGIGGTLEKSSTVQSGLGDEAISVELELPDGRSFTYHNNPMNQAQLQSPNVAQNSWHRERAFVNRPYGQMLWLPGHKTPFETELGLGEVFGQTDTSSDGWTRVQGFLDSLSAAQRQQYGFDATPKGQVAVLKTEDGHFLFYQWSTGRLLRQDRGDVSPDVHRRVDFAYALDAEGREDSATITDHLNRQIRIERNDDGTISRIVDPRGFAAEYTYSQGRLTQVRTRNGELRWLRYEDPQFPNNLTAMVVDSQAKNEAGYGVQQDGIDARIEYEYDSSGRLGGVSVAGGGVHVDYLESGNGTSTQVLEDKKTGARTEVVYDDAGRVLREIDASGVEKSYAYTPEPVDTPGDGIIPPPAGILASETANGLTTEYDYDLGQYNKSPTGINGIARGLVDFWLNRMSDGQITNDYPYAPDRPNQMAPGYLTNRQIQPKETNTVAVGADGVDHGQQNTVALDLKEPGLQGNELPQGHGRSYGLTDMQGRGMRLGYGDNGQGTGNGRESVGAIRSASGDTETKTTYVPSGRFVGRTAERQTWRNGNLASVTRYTYSDGTAQAAFPEMVAALTAAIPDANNYFSGQIVNGVRTGLSSMWVEKQFVQRSRSLTGPFTSVTVYLDATGNNVATQDSEGKWTFTILDAEERPVVSAAKNGNRTYSTYNAAGAIVASRQVTEESDTTVRYVYDAEGRLQKTILPEGRETVVSYGEESGLRSLTNIDENGNATVTLTDASGRVVEERQITREGAILATRLEYDDNGRVHRTTNPRGLVTEITYDDAGREREVVQIAEGTRSVNRRGYDRFGRLAWSQTPLQIPANRVTTYLYKNDLTTDPGYPATPWTTLDDVTNLDDRSYGQLVATFHEDEVETGERGPWGDASDNDWYFASKRFWETYAYDARGRQEIVTRPTYRTPTEPAVPTSTKVYFLDDGSSNANQPKYVVFNWDAATWTEGGNHGVSADRNITFQFAYDSDGERSQVTYPSGLVKQWISSEDAEGRPTGYLESQADAPGNLTVRRETSYLPNGRPDFVVDGVGNRVSHVYGAERLEARILRNSGNVAQYSHRYSWLEDGSLESVRTFRGESDLEADLIRSETRVADIESGVLRQVVKTEGTIDYQHDYFNAVRSVSFFGETTEYKYDNFGRLSNVRSRAGEWNYTYNTAGLKERVDNIRSGETERREYDALGRLTRIRHTDGGGAVRFEVEYLLGVDGTRRGAIERRGAEAKTVAFEYDALGRMVREVRAAGEHRNLAAIPAAARILDTAWLLDADGNRLRETDGLVAGIAGQRNYAYEMAGTIRTQRLLSITRGGSATPEETYGWTANGELQSRSYADGRVETYTWNPDGTLKAVAFSGQNHAQAGSSVEYLYDAEGALVRRTLRNAAGVVQSDEKYLVDSGENPTGRSQILATIDATTNRVAELSVWADELKATTTADGTEIRTVATDAIGSIRQHGADPHDYTAFGQPIGEPLANPAATKYAFAGELRDAATGFQNHRARWLDPRTGTFASTDPEFDFPAGFGHERLYAGAAPMTYTDPLGTFSLVETSISASIQATIRAYVGNQIRSFLLSTLLTLIGFDPARLLAPFIDALARAFGLDTLYPQLASRFDKILSDFHDEVEAVIPPGIIELIHQIGFAIKVITFAKDGADLMVQLIKALMSRSLVNAAGLISEMIEFAEALYDFLETPEAGDTEPEPEEKSIRKQGGKGVFDGLKFLKRDSPPTPADSEKEVLSFINGWIEHHRENKRFVKQATFQEGIYLGENLLRANSTRPDGAQFDLNSPEVVEQMFEVKRTTKLFTTDMIEKKGGFVFKTADQAVKRHDHAVMEGVATPRQVILFDLRHMPGVSKKMKAKVAQVIEKRTKKIVQKKDVYFVTQKGIQNYKGNYAAMDDKLF